MVLKSVARDCLYLNWALPAASLPPAPRPLRYETHATGGSAVVFFSLVLFRQERLHLRTLPLLRLSYPQLNTRLYVRDADDVPAVLFTQILVPFWMLPAVRWVGRQAAHGARFDLPGATSDTSEPWRWRVRRGHERLELVARSAAPAFGPGPRLGGWEDTVAYFRQRPRGYVAGSGGLERIETSHPPVAVRPLVVEVVDGGLLSRGAPESEPDAWSRPHSSWLCPRIPFVFELGSEPEPALPRQVPATG